MAGKLGIGFGIILIIIGIFLFNFTKTTFFSVQDFTNRFGNQGPLIELSDTSDPNFDVNNVVGGKVAFTIPVCDEERGIRDITVAIDNRIIAFESCNEIRAAQVTQLFEIDPSFLSLPIEVSGADSISYFIKVDCVSNNDCIDPIRRTNFICDIADYTCKAPGLQQDTQIPISEKPQEEKTNFLPLIIIGIGILAFIFRDKLFGRKV